MSKLAKGGLYLSDRYDKLPKIVRFLLKLTGIFLTVVTAPVWFPIALALYVLCALFLGIIELWEQC